MADRPLVRLEQRFDLGEGELRSWATRGEIRSGHAVAGVGPRAGQMRDQRYRQSTITAQMISLSPQSAPTCGQRVAICGLTSVNTLAHARRRPCAHLITVENLQAGSLGWYALVAQGIEQRFPKPRVAGSIPAGGTFYALSWENTRTGSADGLSITHPQRII